MLSVTEKEERAIIDRVLQGNTNAFEQLVREHEKGVYNLALRMLGREQDALDASQESFFKAYRSLRSFRGDSRFSVWLYRLTSNVCLDMLRKASREGAAMSVSGEDLQDLPDPDSRHDPQEILERREKQRAVHAGLGKLPEPFRQILILRDINGLSYEEIGQVLDLEPGTVRSRLFRARQKLAGILMNDGNFPPSASSQMEKKGGGGHA